MKLQYIHPFLFAIAPALFLWQLNLEEVTTLEAVQAMVFLIIFAGIVFGLNQLLYRNSQKAAILTSVFLFIVLVYRYIFYNPFLEELMRNRYSLLISFVVIAILGYALKKTHKDLTTSTYIFTVISGMFVLMSVFQLSTGLWERYTYKAPISDESAFLKTNEKIEEEELRDIYYIILDEYMAPDVIRDIFGYDEIDEMTNWLEEQGFFVAKSSKSNYEETVSSLPSMLNMRYLSEEELINLNTRVQMTLNHRIKDVLKNQGYTYIHMGTDWFDFYNYYADENIYFGYFRPYQMMLVDNSILSPLERRWENWVGALIEKAGFWYLDKNFVHWKRVQFKFEELAKIPERKEPTFVFAHFNLPHGPMVFDAEGNYVTREEMEKQSPSERYLNHIVYANKQIKILIEKILENSQIEPIIIIQGDHGVKSFTLDPDITKQLPLTPKEVRFLPLRILNTYYFPDGGDKLLYNSISPVNSFRVLINYYLNGDYELLDDMSYKYLNSDLLEKEMLR